MLLMERGNKRRTGNGVGGRVHAGRHSIGTAWDGSGALMPTPHACTPRSWVCLSPSHAHYYLPGGHGQWAAFVPAATSPLSIFLSRLAGCLASRSALFTNMVEEELSRISSPLLIPRYCSLSCYYRTHAHASYTARKPPTRAGVSTASGAATVSVINGISPRLCHDRGYAGARLSAARLRCRHHGEERCNTTFYRMQAATRGDMAGRDKRSWRGHMSSGHLGSRQNNRGLYRAAGCDVVWAMVLTSPGEAGQWLCYHSS